MARKRWFQLHLSSAIVLVLTAGVFVALNMNASYASKDDATFGFPCSSIIWQRVVSTNYTITYMYCYGEWGLALYFPSWEHDIFFPTIGTTVDLLTMILGCLFSTVTCEYLLCRRYERQN